MNKYKLINLNTKREAAILNDAKQANIVNCCNGKKGYKTVKGFIYGYK